MIGREAWLFDDGIIAEERCWEFWVLGEENLFVSGFVFGREEKGRESVSEV